MKRLINIFIILNILCVAIYADFKAIVISKNRVNFRNEATLKSNIINKFQKGRILTYISEKNNWYYVMDEGPGEEGWIHKSCTILYSEYIKNIITDYSKKKKLSPYDLLLLAKHYKRINYQKSVEIYKALINEFPETPYLSYETNIAVGMLSVYEIYNIYTENNNIKTFEDYSDTLIHNSNKLIKSYTHYVKGIAYYEKNDFKNAYIEWLNIINNYPKIKYGKYIEEIGYYGSFSALEKIYEKLYYKNHLNKKEFIDLINKIINQNSDKELIKFAKLYKDKISPTVR